MHVRRWLQRGLLTCENVLRKSERHRMNSSWLCRCLRCVCFLFWQKILHSTDLWCHILAGVFLDDSCWFHLIFNCFTKPCKSGSFSRTRWGNIIPVNFLWVTGIRVLFGESPHCRRLAKHIWRLPKISKDVLFWTFPGPHVRVAFTKNNAVNTPSFPMCHVVKAKDFVAHSFYSYDQACKSNIVNFIYFVFSSVLFWIFERHYWRLLI